MTDIKNTLEIFDAIETRRNERRSFLRFAGGSAVALGGASLLAACGGDDNNSVTPTPTPTPTPATGVTDPDVLNFALNLEYLEAQFYAYAAFGVGLNASLLTGVGTQGAVVTGTGAGFPRQVAFQDAVVQQYAREIAIDEVAHVAFLRSALGASAAAQPAINISGGTAAAPGAFSLAARAAGVVDANTGVFDPYADDNSFLLGAYIFEDVGVSAYKGAAPLISNKTYLEAAAGILAAEAYHAGLIRTILYRKGLQTPNPVTALITNANKISDARDSLDGTVTNASTGVIGDDDQGITGSDATISNIVPTDANGLAYSRSTGQVLNIVYLSKAAVSLGGFFPAGVNGSIRTSAANA
ncbi:ferritin-like protein [Sphingomonas sp. PP-CE-3A-406]|uniref:ferritin-like domain-containing protein n=1 Tax=Sphingomonas sp. PP-CE-3A-406 TaxID=2135659 RepID=UPI000EF9C431|nr:ferritin-like domain-containing protein [Sphingomonas sp. PP-CE-3A-406]RMB51572.1 ferritin-like protein [Sphingomonas sp. PP-CE-3A-406]